jgi:hypothetical protein
MNIFRDEGFQVKGLIVNKGFVTAVLDLPEWGSPL